MANITGTHVTGKVTLAIDHMVGSVAASHFTVTEKRWNSLTKKEDEVVVEFRVPLAVLRDIRATLDLIIDNS